MREIDSVAKLTGYFSSLPGVGRKTAARYAYAVINMSADDAAGFAAAILEVKEKIGLCRVCGNFTDADECEICRRRDHSVILVVKEPKDVAAIEKIGDYTGVYHILHGVLDPSNNVGPNEIRISGLLRRLDGAKEVIIATNPDLLGEATAMYIAKLIKPFGVKTSRIAHGLPVGAEIEYADAMTLSRAISDRKEIL
ncbi:MAG: recombination mediator RecR [Clostridiales bacterium]|nr:recombination mediator RecR [Clostridiales bacterium]